MKISARVKEKVARTIADFFTAAAIINVFDDAKIPADRESGSKWKITLDALNATNTIDDFFRIIEEFCHPLNFDKPEHRENFINTLNMVLTYDDLEIQSTDRTAKVCPVGSEGFHKDVDAPKENKPETTAPLPKEVEKTFDDLGLYNDTEIPTEDDAKEAEDIRKITENKEVVRQLRDFHQALIDVVETFCQNLKKPNKELNDSYLFLMRKIQDIVYKLDLQHRFYVINVYKPFKDLYSAEIEWNGAGDGLDIRLNTKLSWDAIRPSLYKTHSDIVKICAIAEEDSDMSDDQKSLEKIAGFVAKARIEKASKTDNQRKVFPIEIINPVQIAREVRTRTSSPLAQRNTTDLKVDQNAGDLESFNDGSIRYKGELIEMRSQLKVLCRLFIGRPNRLITIDDIREELIRAEKRKTIPNATISKYVSELRAILMNYYKRDAFVNQKEEGWFFKP